MKIVVTRPLPQQAQKMLQSHFTDIYQWTEQEAIPRDILLRELKDASGLLCMITDRIDRELIDQSPKLKVISTCSVGLDHIQLNALGNIKLGHTPGVLTRACADLAITLILVYTRRIREAMMSVTDGFQKTFSPTYLCGSELNMKTVGVIGRGRIGLELQHRLLSFGVSKLLYTTSQKSSDSDLAEHKLKHEKDEDERLAAIGQYYNLDLVEKVDLQELLQQSDIVVVTCSLNDSTRNMINKSTLKLMKKTAVLVNIARGPIVNTKDLVEAIQQGVVQGAALDVTDPEPLPKGHPMLGLVEQNKVILLPHVSSATMETRLSMAKLSIDNLIAGLTDKPMPHEFTSL